MRLILEKTNDGIFSMIDADEPDSERAGVGAMSIDPAREVEILHALLMAAAEQGVNSPILEAAEVIAEAVEKWSTFRLDRNEHGPYCALARDKECNCGLVEIAALVKAVRDRQRQVPRPADETPEQARRRRANLVNPELMKKLRATPGRDVSIGLKTGLNMAHFLITAWIKDGGPEGKECTYLEALEIMIMALVERHSELSEQYLQTILDRSARGGGGVMIPAGSNAIRIPGLPPDLEEHICVRCGSNTYVGQPMCGKRQTDQSICGGALVPVPRPGEHKP